VTELEQYMFDLNGYLILRNVLSSQEVDEINAVMDRVLPDWHVKANAGHIITGFDEESAKEENTDPKKNCVGYYSGRLLDWGEPIRRLVGHDKIMSYMIKIIGSALRLDHQYAILMRAKPASAGHPLHCAGTPYEPVHSYHFRDGRFFSALTTVSYALTDVPPGGGGFCVVPGSHKCSTPPPRHLLNINNPPECIVHLPLQRGDAVIFTEALTHGALPWISEDDGERRALLFKYCPGYMQWETRLQAPEGDYEWEEHQKYLLQPAYHHYRPLMNWPPARQTRDAGGAAAH
jgi:ectoine hydroxylase-related dioxygenase (phytanoyl-CoA dioxygenase family)